MPIHFINQMVLDELYSIQPMLKSIENCKIIQEKKRFHIFVTVGLGKRN